MTDGMLISILTWSTPILATTFNIIWAFFLNRGLKKTTEKREAEKAEAQRITEAAVNEKKKDKAEIDILKSGVQALLHNAIYTKAQELLEQGHCTVEDKRNLEYLYRPYHAGGGNGTGTFLYEEVSELPLAVPMKKKENTEVF